MKINIAIDGYSACGKSTLAKQLAAKLNYTYIDSGAMYRAIALYFIQHKINFTDESAVVAALPNIQIGFSKNENQENRILLNGEDVSEAIRAVEVADIVSPVAAIIAVRTFAVAQQQVLEKDKGVVMDGRDVGTVVFPDAALKIFVTASIAVRAQRRYDELKANGKEASMEWVKNNLQERDHLDTTRPVGPLKKAEDALVLDNTDLTREEQLQVALNWVAQTLNQLEKPK